MSTPLQARLLALPHVRRALVTETVDSTNLVVARDIAGGGGPGTVAVARRQTAGRGRRGRRWADVPRGNVALSIAVAMPPTGVELVPLAAALALRDVLEGMQLATSLKWPNDVRLVVDGRPRKAAGILVEGHPGVTPPIAVVGIGIDVDWRGIDRAAIARDAIGQDAIVQDGIDEDAIELARESSGEPASPRGGWTSVAEASEAAGLDGEVDRDGLVVAVVGAVEARRRHLRDDPSGVLADYRVACATLGQQVHVDLGSRRFTGWATDLGPRGSLVVTTAHGRELVAAGDVVHVRDVTAGQPGGATGAR